MKTKFKSGIIVQSPTGLKIFVTGEGDQKSGYDCFAGIVIEKSDDTLEKWPLGMFSDTWTLSVFEKVKGAKGEKEMESIFEKAAKWDALDDKIGGFYVDEKGDELEEGEGGDLADIGEAAAIAFGYL
jgi:hypothetical protein